MKSKRVRGEKGKGEATKEPAFAHHSEREFARILDFYQIDWEYEPRSFDLQWDDQGNPTESFTPDFYLPEFGLFIELTTLRQSLVTKKNRKLRRLRELYPDVNIKLFYKRDFKSLMTKYGIRVPLSGEGAAGAETSTVTGRATGSSADDAPRAKGEKLSPE